jgi:pyruvate kinase
MLPTRDRPPSLTASAPPQRVLLKRRRTKIVATLGPASNSEEVIGRLIEAGVDVFRLNMSHGRQEDHRLACERVRAAAARLDRPVAVLADLCGPKLRVGQLGEGGIRIESGSRVVVTTRPVVGQPGLIPSDYAELAQDVHPGDRILLDDGLLELRVEGVEGTEVDCTVIHGGLLKTRKGMNLPGVNVSAPSLTDKDRDDARFALDLGVDFIALSFVRRAADLAELKALMAGHPAHLITKIEMPEAVEAIDEIIDACDGIMVARGDLGVEMPPETVPIAQRRLLARARAKGKPAIVATQMLESMVTNPRPTRAEVSDVSTAVFAGADAIMLSAETAAGAYPVESVEMMDRVARWVESYQWEEGAFDSLVAPAEAAPPLPLHTAFARSTAQLSRDLRVRAIVVLSRTGTTARMVASARPAAPLLVVTDDPSLCRRANLLWGVVSLQVEAGSLRQPHTLARQLVKRLGLAEDGQYILTITGFKAARAETAPTLTVLSV